MPLRIKWEVTPAPLPAAEREVEPPVRTGSDDIEIHFQPVFSTRTGQTAGHEAFARVRCRTAEGIVLKSIRRVLDNPEDPQTIPEIDFSLFLAAVRRATTLGLGGGSLLIFVSVRPETLLDREHRLAFARLAADGTGIPSKRIVLEIAERDLANNLSGLREAANSLRDAGFRLAVDGFGAGPASLNFLTIVEPDIVKISRELVSDIDRAVIRFNLVNAVASLCHRMGIKVAACGIEREEELAAVQDIGIELIQGEFLAPPAPVPPPAGPHCLTALSRPAPPLRIRGEPQFIGDISRAVSPIRPSDSIMTAFRRFLQEPHLTSLPVVRKEAAVGMAYRHRFLENAILGRCGYGWSLNAFKTIGDMMETGILLVESNVTIEDVAKKIWSRTHASVYDDVLVSKTGKYFGVAAVSDLLEAVTEKSLNTARNANPLTGLPGNTVIQREIERRLRQNVHFDACYIDIDNFKPYNDYYGFERGDFVIKTLAKIVEAVLSGPDPAEASFVGHIGGDDFIVLARPGDSMQIAERIVAGFEGWLPGFHGISDYQRGMYVSSLRGGAVATFRLLSLSIGIVSTEVNKIDSYAELASLATEVKKAAKAQEGSLIVRDRRLGGKDAVQHPSD